MSSRTETRLNDEKHDLARKKESKDLKCWYGATLLEVRKLTPSTTGLSLLVDTENPEDMVDGAFRQTSPPTTRFSFFPGQWVDFYVPHIQKIGGYSLTSLPSALPRIELAVKASRHPPALWVTEHASVGDKVKVRVGGDFVYDEAHMMQRNQRENSGGTDASSDQISESKENRSYNIFIAGGVGINPLFGMFRQIHENLTNGSSCSKAALLFSASSKEELLFEGDLIEMATKYPQNLWVCHTVTQSGAVVTNQGVSGLGTKGPQNSSVHSRSGRVGEQLIVEALDWLGCERDAVKVYICGPAGMAEDMLQLCSGQGIPKASIRFEQWW